MLLDTQAEFSNAQAVTASAISTNVIDLTLGQSGLATIDIGTGEPIYLVIVVQTTTASGGTTTVGFTLESDSTADLATSATVHITVAAINKTVLVAGYRVCCIALPSGDYERYLGVRYTVNTTNLSAGAFDAFLTKVPDNNSKFYADALSIA